MSTPPSTRSASPDASIPARVARVRARIRAAEAAAGRAVDAVRLVAVAKTRSAGEVRAGVAAGLDAIGENYLQEALAHQRALADLAVEWHFIGAVQSNKTRTLAESFDWVHTVDREKIARRLSDARPAGRPDLNLCLQVNLDDEASKAGVAPDDVAALLDAVCGLPRIRVRGLMAIPAPRSDAADQRAAFERLAALQGELAARHPELGLDTLSMGMSDDLESAVAAGATLVRIGTALFGPRPAGPRLDRNTGKETP